MSQKTESTIGLIGGLLVAGATFGMLRNAVSKTKTDSTTGLRNTKQTRRIAAHEAGHALVAWAVGCNVKSVTIKDCNGDGEADQGLVENIGANLAPWNRLAIFMAGLVGEAFVVGQHNPHYAGSDLRRALETADEIIKKGLKVPWRRPGGRTVSLKASAVENLETDKKIVMEEAASFARSLIRRNRTLFEKIRRTLLEQGSINEETFAELTSNFRVTKP